ncbi:MAG: hypothetical protein JNK04_00405, partial [Myxococcales bacterium]|nr:hypothetical protein [Myxococcales bacterium]
DIEEALTEDVQSGLASEEVLETFDWGRDQVRAAFDEIRMSAIAKTRGQTVNSAAT